MYNKKQKVVTPLHGSDDNIEMVVLSLIGT